MTRPGLRILALLVIVGFCSHAEEGTTFTPSEATKTKPNISTKLFIHLVTALLLLNFTFLINDLVANMNSPSGCEAIAFLMHYFMLVTFTWFGMHAFHLCLQMYVGSSITIKRYVLKVSVSSWTIPSIFVIAFLIAKKYGELRIYTNDSEKISKMCWIIDNKAHMIVNVGYYIVVFILTFSTVIISMYWLCRFKQSKTDNLDKNETSKRILFTLGLCSQLGVTWGFAFFASRVRVHQYVLAQSGQQKLAWILSWCRSRCFSKVTESLNLRGHCSQAKGLRSLWVSVFFFS
ncbi:G-protein coupled receptor 64 [Oryzias melastigma]|uniref:G-protein coupled receptor 64 n=1 Tax=Oryzias melastigma TaxID=30732 RepID=A0A834C9D5_ORYME|nr:G-protein coupled receptor 64 [Oryzias melastigma]